MLKHTPIVCPLNEEDPPLPPKPQPADPVSASTPLVSIDSYALSLREPHSLFSSSLMANNPSVGS